MQASDVVNTKIIDIKQFVDGSEGPVFRNVDLNSLCGRDHKWRLMSEAVDRQVCDCALQFRQVHEMYRLWNCTHQLPIDPYPPVVASAYIPPPRRVCSYEPDPALALATPWQRNVTYDVTLKDYRVLGAPIRFPRAGDELTYFRYCEGEPVRNCSVNVTGWPHDSLDCLQFCSWREASTYIDRKV